MGRVFILVIGLAGASACASTGAVPQPFPTPKPSSGAVGVTSPEAPADSVAADAYAISGTALALRGTPYKNGGSDPSGFDCSGFVWYVFGQHGVRVPRSVSEQSRAGNHVDAADLRPGDLLFFATNGTRDATHVAISIGGDEFVHAPSSAGQVRVERLGSSYWAPRFLEARRLQ
jgi:cell wall-associated NlpC family hydrolase